MSSRSEFILKRGILLPVLLTAIAVAQYPGQVSKKSKDNTPELRAIGVLEWTGDEGKPKTSRLVPVTVYDGQALQDGGVYLARPLPLALSYQVEYELERNGKPIGLFDIKNAGQEEGSWVGFGTWRPIPSAKPALAKPVLSDIDDQDYSDRPVLHRKQSDGSGKGNGNDSSASGPPPDPDRPTLHKKPNSDDSGSGNSGSGSGNSGTAADPNRPTLHKPPNSDSNAASTGSDPDRPKLHAKTSSDAHDDGSGSGVADPDRPTLKRGKSSGKGTEVLPTVMGVPADMQQAVAVSDAKSRPEHHFSYAWANPADEEKMKQAMEDIAREALGLKQPTAATAPKRTTARTKAQPATPPLAPAPLDNEEFRVFELAYGSGATMVLSAHTNGPLSEQKFVTLIAQPDLYGNVLVLLKHVTDGAHLDENPRMHLVDAVDALADNRGELLFELRGSTQRQFALYRVLRGTAEKLFVSGGGAYETAGSE